MGTPANMGAAPSLQVPVNPLGVYLAQPTATADGSVVQAGVDGVNKASNTNPEPSRVYGSPQWATTQIDVTTGQVTLLAARTTRSMAIITNLGTVPVYVGTGSPAVSATNGALLPGVVGATLSLPLNAAIVANAASTQRVSVIEIFG